MNCFKKCCGNDENIEHENSAEWISNNEKNTELKDIIDNNNNNINFKDILYNNNDINGKDINNIISRGQINEENMNINNSNFNSLLGNNNNNLNGNINNSMNEEENYNKNNIELNELKEQKRLLQDKNKKMLEQLNTVKKE